MKQFSVIVIGLGSRGCTYTNCMATLPECYRIVGVADPVASKRKRFQQKFGLPEEACFADWRDILDRPKMADIAVITTMDADHYGPAMKAIELGYDILLEKPVAPTPEECRDIANAADKKGVRVLVCHVLRYADFFKRVKSIVDSGKIGKVVSIDHVEGIGDIHFTHSYVRGNWHSEKETAPMLLAKSCHDLDILQWILGKKCRKVHSFGSLTYFTPENAPEGAPVRCFGGDCPIADACNYCARRIYIENPHGDWYKSVFRTVVSKKFGPSDEELARALEETDYGLCVFHANNDVNDHQIVNMEFEDGETAALTVNAFNLGGRYIRIYGTKGELFAYMSDDAITVSTYADRKTEKIPVQAVDEMITGGHGGGDARLVRDLYDYLCDSYTGFSVADIHTSVANHMIGFAAEEALHNDTVVDLDVFCKKYGFTI